MKAMHHKVQPAPTGTCDQPKQACLCLLIWFRHQQGPYPAPLGGCPLLPAVHLPQVGLFVHQLPAVLPSWLPDHHPPRPSVQLHPEGWPHGAQPFVQHRHHPVYRRQRPVPRPQRFWASAGLPLGTVRQWRRCKQLHHLQERDSRWCVGMLPALTAKALWFCFYLFLNSTCIILGTFQLPQGALLMQCCSSHAS